MDHGTAPALYGKNLANPMGQKYVLELAYKIKGPINHGALLILKPEFILIYFTRKIETRGENHQRFHKGQGQKHGRKKLISSSRVSGDSL